MAALFVDRHEAGRRLAGLLRQLRGHGDLIVLGLPRGGVPVGYEVAKSLGAPLDVFLVRKLGIPGHAEFAMGAVASGGIRVLNHDVIQMLHIRREIVAAVTTAERRALERGERALRLDRPFPKLEGKTVVVVDDGVATGATMLAAVQALRRLGPAAIVAAAPVMSWSARSQLTRAADGCVCVAAPEPFHSVGAWYQEFPQTTDTEVRALLGDAPAERPAVGGGVC